MRTRYSLISSITIVLLVVAVTRAQAGKVTVVNTASNPVPVSITGTPTVNIGNLPDGTNLVQVASSTNAPVVVRDADNPARQIYQRSLQSSQSNVTSWFVVFDAVPAGKRLVVEFISVEVDVPVGQNAIRVTLDRQDRSVHRFPLSLQGSGLFVAAQQMRMYFEAGESPRVAAFKDSFSGAIFLDATITGYYIDVP
jgi:hypothetical protein